MHAELHFLTSVLSIVKQIQVYHIDQIKNFHAGAQCNYSNMKNRGKKKSAF